MIIYNNMAHRSEENINNNLTAMQSAYHLPRLIICEGDGRGCGTDTESVDTEPSTVVVPQNNTAEECREEEFDNNTAKEEDEGSWFALVDFEANLHCGNRRRRTRRRRGVSK